MLYLGIDGGGTKTDLCLFDSDKGIVAQLHRSSLDYHEIGLQGYRMRLEQDVRTICDIAGRSMSAIDAVTVGTPCYGENASISAQLEYAAKDALSTIEKVFVVNDVLCAMMGALGGGNGICILAGTGSMAMGIDACGQIARAGGWSRYYSDAGSAHWLGMQGMHLFTLQADGVVKRGPLYDLVMQRYRLASPLDFISVGDQTFENREKTAAFQRLLLEAVEAGDESARKLYTSAAEALASLVLCLRKQLSFVQGEKIPVAYAGGLFRVGALIQEPLKALLPVNEMDFVPPRCSAVAGAVLYAARQDSNEAEASVLRQLAKDER